jgi:hypothetical protein
MENPKAQELVIPAIADNSNSPLFKKMGNL